MIHLIRVHTNALGIGADTGQVAKALCSMSG